MEIALHAALFNAARAARGGSIDDAFALVDEVIAEVGEPTTPADLRQFLAGLDARSGMA